MLRPDASAPVVVKNQSPTKTNQKDSLFDAPCKFFPLAEARNPSGRKQKITKFPSPIRPPKLGKIAPKRGKHTPKYANFVFFCNSRGRTGIRKKKGFSSGTLKQFARIRQFARILRADFWEGDEEQQLFTFQSPGNWPCLGCTSISVKPNYHKGLLCKCSHSLRYHCGQTR